MSWVAHETQAPDEDGDVFAQDATVHPAFRQSLAVASDIYERLFDEFYKGQLFARWVHYKDSWQLNVVGGPGAGKASCLKNVGEEDTTHSARLHLQLLQ